MELGGCSHDKIFFVGPDKHPRTHGQFVNARFARFTNSNLKLRLRLSLDRGFSISLTSFARPKNLGHPPLGVCQALEKTYCANGKIDG